MSRSHFKLILFLLFLNGVVIEVNNAYKQSVGISNIVLPAISVLQLPQAMHHMPWAQMPFVKQYDSMTLTSGTMMFYDN